MVQVGGHEQLQVRAMYMQIRVHKQGQKRGHTGGQGQMGNGGPGPEGGCGSVEGRMQHHPEGPLNPHVSREAPKPTYE